MPQRTYSVLLIDQSEQDYEAIRRELYLAADGDRYDISIEWRKTLGFGLSAIRENSYDAILLDLTLPDSNGAESFHKTKEVSADVPIVIVTALDNDALAIELVSAGAQDYIVKGKFPGLLFRSLLCAIRRQGTLSQLEKSERATRSATMAKSAFFANMSHEIRNPLTSIIGYSEALMGRGLTKQQSTKALSAVFSNGKHLLQLINDILDLSKIDADELKIEPSHENILPLLRELKQTFVHQAEKKDVTFSVEFETPVPTKLHVDLFRLKQILINLIGNALKFTKEGYVKLSVKADIATESAVFEVKDSGVGISEEGRKRLFKAFSQGESGRAKEFGGTGLGLTISKRLIEQMGGSLDCKSRVGIGSIFTVSLPLDVSSREHLSKTVPNLDELGKGSQITDKLKITGKVLVADDLEDNRELIALLLRKVGLEVELAENGGVALEKASKGDFDLVLLDMEMPVMSGQEVARSLRARSFAMPIVAITAMMLEESQALCLEAGCDACLPKPFGQDELYVCVLKFLGEKGKEHAVEKEQPTVKDDALSKVRVSFLRRLPSRLDEIESALTAKDLNRLKAEAHRLIGAGMFGFQDLSYFGGTLESLVIQEQTGGLGLIEALVNKVRSEVSRISMRAAASMSDKEEAVPQTETTAPAVLVLDDDEANLKVVCRVLNVKGFLAAPARNASQALALCAENQISLLIVALETADAENYELIAQVRKKLERNIPVIAMTNHLPSEVRARLGQYNVDHLIEKPISRDQLLSAIDSLIATSIAGVEAAAHQPVGV